MSITSLPAAIVARTTLLESDTKSMVPTSEIVWAGILAVAEVTSSPLPVISTEKEEFLASLSINTLFWPGLLPVTSTMISPGKVTFDRSSKADCCSPLFIGPAIVADPPSISDPSGFFNCTFTSPRGITRLLIIVRDNEPSLKTAAEKSEKLKSFVTGSRSKDGIFTVFPFGISETLG